MSAGGENPYNSTLPRADPLVGREEVLAVMINDIQRGSGLCLVGCHGIGKSSLLKHLHRHIKRDYPEYDLFHFESIWLAKSTKLALDEVADKLIERHTKILRASEKPEEHIEKWTMLKQRSDGLSRIVEGYRDMHDGIERLVFVFDDVDCFPAWKDEFFEQLDHVRMASRGAIVVMITGDTNLLWPSRAMMRVLAPMKTLILEPLTQEHLLKLAKPFSDEQKPLSEEVISALYSHTGGNPKLAVYGLGNLWDKASPTGDDVFQIFQTLKRDYPFALERHRDSVFTTSKSQVIGATWRLLKERGGKVSREELWARLLNAGERSADCLNGATTTKIFQTLRAKALIRCSDDAHETDPVAVEIIPSIFANENDFVEENAS